MRINELLENIDTDTIPAAPGTVPIPPGTVRLYHQTTESALHSILKSGLNISHARGIEGPRAIYASETGFYGKPGSRPTIEFYVDQDKWDDPFVLQDIPPSQIIAGHLPWHKQARYIETHPEIMQKALAGEYDDLKGDAGLGVAYVKQQHGKRNVTNEALDELLNELTFQGSQCTKDCSGHAAGYQWSMKNGGKTTVTPSPSFDKGTGIAADQVTNKRLVRPKIRNAQGKFSSGITPKVNPPQNSGTIPSRGPTATP